MQYLYLVQARLKTKRWQGLSNAPTKASSKCLQPLAKLENAHKIMLTWIRKATNRQPEQHVFRSGFLTHGEAKIRERSSAFDCGHFPPHYMLALTIHRDHQALPYSAEACVRQSSPHER